MMCPSAAFKVLQQKAFGAETCLDGQVMVEQ